MPINNTQLKCLLVFSVFAIIGFGPISPGCLMGMFIVIKRPQWFLTLADNLYINKSVPLLPTIQSQQPRIKCFLCLFSLFIIDIAPVPVTPVIAFIIILSRPAWFYRTIKAVYSN